MTDCVPKYEPLPEWSQEEMEEVLCRGDVYEMSLLPLVAGLNPPDAEWAQSLCVRLSGHSDVNVRGNAMLGFGYLAMTCRKLDEAVVKPLLEDGLHDHEEWVRGQAGDAVEMCKMYLKWKSRTPPRD